MKRVLKSTLLCLALPVLGVTQAAAQTADWHPGGQIYQVQFNDFECSVDFGTALIRGDKAAQGDGLIECIGASGEVDWSVEDGALRFDVSSDDMDLMADLFDAGTCSEGWPNIAVGDDVAEVCWVRGDISHTPVGILRIE